MVLPSPTTLEAEISALGLGRPAGRIARLGGGLAEIEGLAGSAHLGDWVELRSRRGPGIRGEVVALAPGRATVLPDGDAEGLAIGDRAVLGGAPAFRPDDRWLGRVVDPFGVPLDGRALLPGLRVRALRASPPAPAARRPLGGRLATGLAVFDTMLPLVRGQRLGLFAGSGVGKTRLLGRLARGVEADVVVLALIGERGRELGEFVRDVLGAGGLARSVVVAATADRSALMRRRAAWAAMSVAEHFRDAGRHVLFLADSVTRFAEAHREIALAGGEPAALGGHPPSTLRLISELSERAGPGAGGAGDITALFTVLVAGSDMDEPIADILRGVLDGHVVLDRAIAERGRFPAVDVLRSVSRSLPDAASEAENALIARARRLMGVYDRAEVMIQAGLYTQGADPEIDAAIRLRPPLEDVLARAVAGGVDESFEALGQALAAAEDTEPGGPGTPPGKAP